MKKLLLALALFLSIQAQSQTWDMNLNFINAPSSPNFGTTSNDPINFFTNGFQRMTLTTTGVLKIDALSGTGNRFLQTDANGNIFPWTGTTQYNNSILFGDGSWRPNLITVDGNNMFIPLFSKFGLGNLNPATELDITGNAKLTGALAVENTLYLGQPNDYSTISYVPATNNSPALFKIGGGGTNNPNNPNTGNTYNPVPWINTNNSPDPQPDWSCINGESTPNSLPPSASILNNVLCIKKVVQAANNTPALAGNINIGHNGSNAFIETQGASLNSSGHQADLFINSRCNRSVYVFGNGSSFAPQSNQIMSIAGKLNVTDNMQLGGGTTTNNFLYNNTRFYIYSPPTVPIGVKIRHGGGGESAIKLIELSGGSKGIQINTGSPTADGIEAFSVLGNGKTVITTTNTQAFQINDGNNLNVLKFEINNSGATYIGEGANNFVNSKLVIGEGVKANYALSLVDNSSTQSLKDFYTIKADGYIEHKIYNAAAMPNNRIMTIVDAGTNNDLFVIKNDGKVYAREVEISAVPHFPDYVFSSEYPLKTIKEIDEYIQKNKHLPGFEKGTHYEQKGININEMMIKQQEKIEEMMLYIIQLEKRLDLLIQK